MGTKSKTNKQTSNGNDVTDVSKRRCPSSSSRFGVDQIIDAGAGTWDSLLCTTDRLVCGAGMSEMRTLRSAPRGAARTGPALLGWGGRAGWNEHSQLRFGEDDEDQVCAAEGFPASFMLLFPFAPSGLHLA